MIAQLQEGIVDVGMDFLAEDGIGFRKRTMRQWKDHMLSEGLA